MILYIFQLNEKSGSYRVKTLPTDAKGLKIVSDLTFYAGSDNQRLTCRICKCFNIRRHHLFIYSFIHLFIYSFIHLFIYSFGRSRWLIRFWLETERYCVRILVGSHVCHQSCAYTVLQTIQRPGVCSSVYGTVPLKSFDSEDHSILIFDIDMLLRYCHECIESDVMRYSLTHSYQ